MFIHNREGILKAKEWGFKRVVLAREVTLDEIKELTALGIETEVFVNGALCVSCSGQCYLSLDQGKRSGNRGECAGPCRLAYSFTEDGKKVKDLPGNYLLSPKDLYTLDRVGEIIESGVDSLKIEGRMKSPEYVGFVVSQYRKAIDSYFLGKTFKGDKDKLEVIFNRGLTEGHLFNKRGPELMNPYRPNHLGKVLGKVIDYQKGKILVKLERDLHQGDGIRIINEKEDEGFIVNYLEKDGLLVNKVNKGNACDIVHKAKVNAGDTVLLTYDKELMEELDRQNNIPRYNNLKLKGRVISGEKLFFETEFNGKVYSVESDEADKALKKAVTVEDIIKQFQKTKDTSILFTEFDLKVSDDAFVPLSKLNVLRKELVEKIETSCIIRRKSEVREYVPVLKDAEYQEEVYVEVKNPEQLEILKDYPVTVFSNNHLENTYPALNRYYNKSKVKSEVIINEAGQITDNTEQISSLYFNAVNAQSVYFLEKQGIKAVELSRELSSEQTETLLESYKELYGKDAPVSIYLYGRRDLMLTKYCLPNTYLTKDHKIKCGLCRKHDYHLKSDKRTYPLEFDSDCFMHIKEEKPFNDIDNIDYYKKLGIKKFRLVFDKETPGEIIEIMNKIFPGKSDNSVNG